MIEKNKTYSLTAIVKNKLIKGSYHTLRAKVFEDMATDNILKAQKVGEGRASMFLIKGENLAKFKKIKKL